MEYRIVGDTIERLTWPRFTARITFNGPASDLEDICLLDHTTDVQLLAAIMRDAGEFIASWKGPDAND